MQQELRTLVAMPMKHLELELDRSKSQFVLMLSLDLPHFLVHVDGVEVYSDREAVEVQQSTCLREMVEIQR